jgi:hypothetical protein
MSEMKSVGLCIHCDRGEEEIPILRFRFLGEEKSICSSCLPILLHRPDRLVGRLKGAENIVPATHSHN